MLVIRKTSHLLTFIYFCFSVFFIWLVVLISACSDVSTDNFLNGNFSSKIRVFPREASITTGDSQVFTVTGKPPYTATIFSGDGDIQHTADNIFTFTPNDVASNAMVIFSGGDASEITVEVNVMQVAMQPSLIANLELWLKGDGITGVGDQDDVSTWLDSSGNNQDFTSNVVSNESPFPPVKCTTCPEYNENCLDGKPCVNFPGELEKCLGRTYDPDLNSESLTLIVVCSTAAAGNHHLFRNQRDYNGLYGFALVPHSTLGWRYYTGKTGSDWLFLYNLDPAVNFETFEVFTLVIDSNGSSATRYMYRNGKLQVQISGYDYHPLVSSRPNTFLLGSSGFNGKIAEFILFSRALTTAERQGIHTYLNDKYPSLEIK